MKSAAVHCKMGASKQLATFYDSEKGVFQYVYLLAPKRVQSIVMSTVSFLSACLSVGSIAYVRNHTAKFH